MAPQKGTLRPAGLDADSNGRLDPTGLGQAVRPWRSGQAQPGPLPPHQAQKPKKPNLQPTRYGTISGTFLAP